MGHLFCLQAREDGVFSRSRAGLIEAAASVRTGLSESRASVHHWLPIRLCGKDPVLGDNVVVVHWLEPLGGGAHVRLVMLELAELRYAVALGGRVYVPYPAREVDALGEFGEKHLHRFEGL